MPKYRTERTGLNKVNKKASLYYRMEQNTMYLCSDSLRTFFFFLNLKQYNMRNTKLIESDFDFRTIEKKFSGKLTKCRYKLLHRYCRINTKRYGNCGHEWDCCGCPSSICTDFTYRHNLVTVTQTIQFNY